MRRLLTSALALLLAALVVAGCSESTEPRQQVTDLRVLGVRLEPPSAAPGDTVTATALVVDPTEEPYTLSWFYCPTPVSVEAFFGVEFDASADLCDLPDHPNGLPIGDIDTGSTDGATFTVPPDFIDQVSGLFEESDLSIDAQALGGLMLITGWHMHVVLIAENDSKRVVTRKRLVVSALGSGLNENPDPPAIFLRSDDDEDEDRPELPESPVDLPPTGTCFIAGAPDQLDDSTTWELTPLNIPEEPPNYYSIGFTGEVTEREERLFFSWFTTAPVLGDGITKTPDPDTTLDLTTIVEDQVLDTDGDLPALPLWVVVRDGRGGTDWCRTDILYDGPLEPAN